MDMTGKKVGAKKTTRNLLVHVVTGTLQHKVRIFARGPSESQPEKIVVKENVLKEDNLVELSYTSGRKRELRATTWQFAGMEQQLLVP